MLSYEFKGVVIGLSQTAVKYGKEGVATAYRPYGYVCNIKKEEEIPEFSQKHSPTFYIWLLLVKITGHKSEHLGLPLVDGNFGGCDWK